MDRHGVKAVDTYYHHGQDGENEHFYVSFSSHSQSTTQTDLPKSRTWMVESWVGERRKDRRPQGRENVSEHSRGGDPSPFSWPGYPGVGTPLTPTNRDGRRRSVSTKGLPGLLYLSDPRSLLEQVTSYGQSSGPTTPVDQDFRETDSRERGLGVLRVPREGVTWVQRFQWRPERSDREVDQCGIGKRDE